MKLQTLRRSGGATVAVLALSGGLAACGSGGSSSTDTSGSTSGDSSSAAADPAADVFGPACDQVPTSGSGSFAGMVNDPVATAASNNSLLTQLVATVTAAGLVDTLNDPGASYTVFAPYDPAFAALPKADVTSLLAGATKDGPTSELAKILTHHVLAERLDPQQVVGDQTTVAGDTLTVSGDTSGMTVSDGTVTADVLCGNIPTGNATVYIIDKVLTGLGS